MGGSGLKSEEGARRGTFADRLVAAVRAKGTCATVNLDPVLASLPKCYMAAHAAADRFDAAAALDDVRDYCRRVIGLVAAHVPVIKLNIAYFECFGGAGVDMYFGLIAEARKQGLIVIGDVKRGDVGHTATLYALAQLSNVIHVSPQTAAPDAVTVSGYFGWDGVKPFVDVAKREGRGVFVLVRTSNDSAATVQDVKMADGRPVHDLVAQLVATWNEESETIGEHGFGSVGAVVATRDPRDAAALRHSMPRSIFLVPGYGAQGGRAEDFVPYVNQNGLGALIAAGRSVIFAYGQPSYCERHGDDWEARITQACRDFVADLGRVIRVR